MESNSASPPDSDAVVISETPFFRSEDCWAICLGWLVLLVGLGATWLNRPDNNAELRAEFEQFSSRLDAAQRNPQAEKQSVEKLRKQRDGLRAQLAINPTKPWLAKLGSWDDDPSRAFISKTGRNLLPGLIGVLVVGLVLFSIGLRGMGEPIGGFPLAFLVVFALAVLSYVLAGQNVIKHYNLEYALWALVVGLLISNTLGTPAMLRPAMRTELYIKTGLVLLGAEILFNRLLSLGVPGIFVSWVVTPIVLVTTYAFGQRILRIPSRSLNMVICADMSVCGVSAAIATAAACRAKKEELSLAIGLSLAFTVIMMVVMPPIIGALGLGQVLGGAWIGGTIDSTGAVAAAGGMLGETALAVAATVKMIQNILIGVVAFGVAVYWVTCVERSTAGQRPGWLEVWWRFPKFVLGFLAASLLFSAVASSGLEGQAMVSATIGGTSEVLRGWFFCLAFVSIGLETDFRQLRKYFVGGKPLILYVCGQALNLLLSFIMCWLMFEKVFPNAAAAIGQ
ncbi:MAG TPA: putative sulfate exporter family transporter [Pirellulales bacterium]|jgi:uncharacterized membrane protein YadS|nr:putative sulfate exporter family transporter [Pirellulales bacterium]